MNVPDVIIADFETRAIEPRPKYPPKPASLALKWPDQSEFKLMAWGHPTGNNCSEKEARGEYLRARNSKYPMLFQFGMFDQDVAETAWDIPLLPWEKFHDTMFLLFYWDPHAPTLSLKPSAERILGIAPEEQDRMYEWIIANIPAAKAKPSTAGAYIADCPYSIVKPYHKGDLVRTIKLFNWLYPRIVREGQLGAYERDRKLMPILLRNAREGMRLDMDGLERDLPKFERGIELADHWIKKRLGIENVDSDRQLGEALYNKNVLTEYKQTAKGQISVSKKYLTVDRFKDKKVFQVLQYRSQMATCVSMFARPWLELGGLDKGVIHPNWAQVRSPKGDKQDTAGARSGRIICSKPNFLNIPKKWKRAITAGYVHPEFLKVPELPYMRKYCLPDKGEEWGKRDFNQQELRLFAHFEEGPVMEGFLSDPKYDIHEDVRAEAERRLIEAALRESFDRDTAKTTVFGRVYGQGLQGLMDALRLSDDDKEVARIIQRAINAAVPSIKQLDEMLKDMSKQPTNGLRSLADWNVDGRPQGEPIRTWGGRLYYVEPPAYSKKYGRDMTFAYKLLNYLLQGSGADVTKETLIRYDSHPKRRGRFVVTVYDEINFSVIKTAMANDQKVMKEVMRSIETDVPLLSDGEFGPNWGSLEKYAI